MERRERMDAAGAVGLVGFSLLLGSNQVIIKLVNEGLQPVFWAGLRSVVAFACLWLWLAASRRPVRLVPGTRASGLLMGAIFSAEFLLLFLALDLTTVTRVSVIFYTMPVFLAVAGHFLLPGERLTRRKTLGLALALSGTAWAILDRGAGGGAGSLAGDLCALAAAMCWAALPLVSRLTPIGRESPEMQIVWQVMVSAPILLVVAPLFGPLMRDPGGWHWAGLGFQGVVIVALSFVFWFRMLGRYPASAVASFSFLTPVFGVLAGWLVLGESVGPVIIGALALVCAGIVLINTAPRRAA